MSSSPTTVNKPSTDAAVTVQPKAKATPLPMEQLVPMAFVLLSEMLSISMLLPYVGLLVADLQGFSVDEAGYLSGMLVGVFMLGQVSSAKTWGWVSDQYGRRPPLIIGLFMGGLMMLFFGLSGSVWLCALFRFIHGLCNGNVLVAKTMMADITDKSNEAKGFSFVSLCYGMGLLVGPGLGGILYDPANSSAMSWAGISKTGIFARHPALLPSLVLFLYSLVGVTVCVFCVKETNPKAKPLPSWVRSFVPCFWREAEQFVKQSAVVEAVETNAESGKLDDSVAAGGLETLDLQEEEQGDTFPVGVLGLHSPVLCEDVRSYDHLCLERMHENDSLHSPPSQSEVCDNKDERVQQQEVRCGDSSPREVANESGVVVVVESSQGDGQEEVKKFGYRQAFERPVTRFMLIMYMIVCGSDMIVSEVFPLWAIASTNAGGLGFDADWVGVILLLNCIPCVSANLLFPKASGRYKDKMAFFRMSIGIAAASVFAMAVAPYAPVPQSMFYVLVITTFSIRQFCCSWCYALVTMLTARSAPPGHTGAIMGINQSCGSITRVIVPFIAAPLFAWSISSPHIFPLNYALVFILSGALFSFGCWRTTSIRTTADGKLELVG